MSKKVLNAASVINELKGQSAYFREEPKDDDRPSKKPEPQEHSGNDSQRRKDQQESEPGIKDEQTPFAAIPTPKKLHSEQKDATLNEQKSMHASRQASMLEISQDDLVETIRKTVKHVGGKPLFIRLTPEEKHEITSLVFTLNEMYRGESHKTSENEIGRIALRLLLEDYHAQGKESILVKVLAALNA